MQSLSAQISPERGWRLIEAGDIELRVPPSWGNVEPDPLGGLVIHNRPRRFRVDGDAVWYASAIELRIPPRGSPLPRSAEAMTTYHKMIGSGSAAAVTIELAIADGVGLAQRRIALRVLNSASLRPKDKSGPMPAERQSSACGSKTRLGNDGSDP